MQDMEIIDLPLDRIVPYENNPRKNANAVDVVAQSIRDFGFRVPILLNAQHVILAGHTRLQAALQLGLDKAPCIVLDHLTEAQEHALRLVDNKSSEPAKWDVSKLKEELAAIEASLPDLALPSLFDFDVADLETLHEDPPQKKDPAPKQPRMCNCPKCQKQFEV